METTFKGVIEAPRKFNSVKVKPVKGILATPKKKFNRVKVTPTKGVLAPKLRAVPAVYQDMIEALEKELPNLNDQHTAEAEELINGRELADLSESELAKLWSIVFGTETPVKPIAEPVASFNRKRSLKGREAMAFESALSGFELNSNSRGNLLFKLRMKSKVLSKLDKDYKFLPGSMDKLIFQSIVRSSKFGQTKQGIINRLNRI